MKRLFSILIMLILASDSLCQTIDSREYKYDFPRRNSFYAENFIFFPSIYYDRLIPINDHFGFLPGVGYALGFVVRGSFLAGNKNHMGTLGCNYWDFQGYFLTANYRYMGEKGFLFKIGYQYMPGEEGFPSIGFGYSF